MAISSIVNNVRGVLSDCDLFATSDVVVFRVVHLGSSDYRLGSWLRECERGVHCAVVVRFHSYVRWAHKRVLLQAFQTPKIIKIIKPYKQVI